jgi:YtfJ family uncharacterized protein
MMKKIIAGMIATAVCAMAIELGSIPPKVEISGKNGGRTDGGGWSSQMLRGKVHILFYVDPDEKDLNEDLTEALKERHFDRKKYASVAVVNLAATWKPNMIIEALLKKKQKAFPDTIYVKDRKKVLVMEWQLADDNSDVLIFDKHGRLIYKKFGKLSQAEIDKVLQLIEKSL